MLPSEIADKKEDKSSKKFCGVEISAEKFAQKSYFFLTEPASSRLSLLWNRFMGAVVLLVAIFYVLRTCDGPNHYEGRDNESTYRELPDDKTYKLIDIVLWTPILVDTFFRLLMVIAVFSLDKCYEVADDFSEDKFKMILHVFDFFSIVPFILDVTMNISDNDINQFAALCLRALYLLSCSKILRVTKDMPSVLAVRLALGKSMVHLVIPLFFFLVFNIFFGVVLYFLEPCYNLETCAWRNLFEACFFSVVTMTTTGYGNQVPNYVPARSVSTIVMLFGSLFMSMPLAIIGNEYENAWAELKERIRMDELEQLTLEVDSKIEASQQINIDGVKLPRSTRISAHDSNFLKRRKLLRKRISKNKAIDEDAVKVANEALLSPLIESKENLLHVLSELKRVLDQSKKMNPSLLLLMCELKGWLSPVQWNIKQCMQELSSTSSIDDTSMKKRMSFMGLHGNAFVDDGRRDSKVSPSGEEDKDSKHGEKFGPERTSSRQDIVPVRHAKPKYLTAVAFLSLFKKKSKAVGPDSTRELPRNLDEMTLGRDTSFALKIVRAAPDIANKGTAEGFSLNMERALDNPDSFRTRLWLLLEFPHSSKGARIWQIFLLCLILLSVFMLYTQTVPSFGSYGESADICGKVLRAYCPNKNDNALDPGCFVHNGTAFTDMKLKYNCETDDCFGHGYNFGAPFSNVTCIDGQPFQTTEQLASNFRSPDFLVSRDDMHKLHDVCLRIECTPVEDGINGNFVWIPVEVFVSFCFTLEICLRLFIANSLYSFFSDFLNIFDMLSVVPFYIDVIQWLNSTPLDFRIIASSPEPVLLVAMKSFKVFRLFKMTRHFSASKVLFETANKALSQIMGILALLCFIVLMFALFLFEVEKGTPCFVGDSNCPLPEDNAHEYKTGQRVLLDKNGDVTQFKTVLESLWFSMVTLTSVGYGDLAPITNLGMFISIFLMLFGAIYLAMPLTVAAATFWSVHQAYVEGHKKKVTKERKIVSAKFAKKIKNLEDGFQDILKKLDEFFEDIQSPESAERKENLTLLQRCLQVEGTLRLLLQNHDSNIRRLSALSLSNKQRRLS